MSDQPLSMSMFSNSAQYWQAMYERPSWIPTIFAWVPTNLDEDIDAAIRSDGATPKPATLED